MLNKNIWLIFTQRILVYAPVCIFYDIHSENISTNHWSVQFMVAISSQNAKQDYFQLWVFNNEIEYKTCNHEHLTMKHIFVKRHIATIFVKQQISSAATICCVCICLCNLKKYITSWIMIMNVTVFSYLCLNLGIGVILMSF